MKTQSLGFIGGGRITKIFLQAFKNKGVSFSTVSVFDIDQQTASELKKLFPDIRIDISVETTVRKDVVFIALHPPVIMTTLEKIKTHLSENAFIISLAPKINIEKIQSVLGCGNILRMIPNASSYINEGYNPFCFAESFEAEKKIQIMAILGQLGCAFEVEEEKLESYAIVSAMLPTYFWFQWKKMIEVGLQTGLNAEESEETVHLTLKAALKLMFESGLNYDELTDLIPVKPIADDEQNIQQLFQTKLISLFNK
nr:NAD(P)-binding domain-containing protein [Bacteroidota bacterium]